MRVAIAVLGVAFTSGPHLFTTDVHGFALYEIERGFLQEFEGAGDLKWRVMGAERAYVIYL
jgi:hypothetical protein